MNSSTAIHLIESFTKYIPTLCTSMHKGQAGRIAIMGGSKEYTGAPYFSGISSLRIGSDICHIFAPTEGGTATAIKTLCPELIVHPLESYDPSDIIPWLLSIHVLIIGPGLGRSASAWSCATQVIKAARDIDLPMVLDGDALRLICNDLDIIKNNQKVILTPNVMEFKGLSDTVKSKLNIESSSTLSAEKLSEYLGNVTIIQKGKEDIITNGKQTVVCSSDGMPRRCGGQGDLLAGAIGTMYAWACLYEKNNSHSSSSSSSINNTITTTTNNNVNNNYSSTLLASFAGCTFVRRCAYNAFEKNRRSTITLDMIAEIPKTFEEIFEKPDSDKIDDAVSNISSLKIADQRSDQ
ncbi:hypothetical protein DFA_08558 [Cavenderia fasciculata]|uniref:ATP-dependent (S)-NAD(P)H-hydrate dehydratase n=1 Tax=Cavenderia fasciculata TaxID=261658 RepID=F4Q2Z8_CACFS|nr:uncharacterized protein DFA_08558 [Cavenderia fasciculata]EGG17562.1 hypothetical protein DFA_08558 [Cavenderia fasciculata]|eukprot:XP_004356046.1 hypothetical protein DFA_08558 [Cavenderia fasciculata]